MAVYKGLLPLGPSRLSFSKKTQAGKGIEEEMHALMLHCLRRRIMITVNYLRLSDALYEGLLLQAWTSNNTPLPFIPLYLETMYSEADLTFHFLCNRLGMPGKM